MERELQKIALELNYYRAQAEELQNQIGTLNALVQENQAAKESLESLEKNSGEALFPIGGGVMVKAKPSVQKVLVEIGAKVIAEKTVSEAIAILDERKEKLVKTISSVQETLQELGGRMMALQKKAEEMQK
ncbi:MAG: prefoldin subunit alpha [Candidatus Micrarchaeota archaeon]